MGKTLIFICGPNGVGKSSVSARLNERLPNSARVDSDWCRCINPMRFTEEQIAVNERNLTALLSNYLACEFLQYVIFSYGLHGPRQGIFDRVLANLSSFDYRLAPLVLTCDTDEQARRLQADGRDPDRIKRALAQTRSLYEALPYARLDTTHLSVDEVAERVIELLCVRPGDGGERIPLP